MQWIPLCPAACLLALAGAGVIAAAWADDAEPLDYAKWEQYRGLVQHPAGVVKPEDLERARRNIARHEWAQGYVQALRASADRMVETMTPEYLEHMIERATAGATGPCPACRAKGIDWHPNGQWSWTPSNPDALTCRVCETVFPNDEFPESVVLQSKWAPEQVYSFAGGDPFMCFGYLARPSFTSMIRGRKLSHVTGQLETCAVAYALTGEAKYAHATRLALLRLAEVFPRYLIRAGYGYGEIADMDPHVAARNLLDLPEDELVFPPNRPDRRLHTGHWSASRVGTSGMDGWWVRRIARAYDLTCRAADEGAPVYSEDERALIERDLLLESAYMALCDPRINNKSVGNRFGAAVVGAVVGHPDLVHFGLEGFVRTVEEWFLPDGGTSESPAYAMMTMSGVMDFALLLRGYSDPPGYRNAAGERLDDFDAATGTRFGDCWQALVWTLQGNLRHPPSADSYRTTGIGAHFAELLALSYPTQQNLALLRELAPGAPSGGQAQQAILYREPALEDEPPALELPDVVFPFLAQGYLRTGDAGRDSLLLLNAGDWGIHHHLDSLDLYYWKDGRELLSDLGYLWDHPDSYQTRRTFAHNTVLVDGRDQRTRGRGGSFHLFHLAPRVKVMEASSEAYEAASEYRRTVVQVEHGEGASYALDIFRVAGGDTRQYVFHGPGNDCDVEGLDLAPWTTERRAVPFAVRFHLPRVGEVFVDDVEIRALDEDGAEGPNLMPNPSVAEGAPDALPPGWGFYIGNGRGDWGVATPGRTDARCARGTARETDAEGRMNVALIAGESDGYRGARAIVGEAGVTYRVRFWLRGDAPQVNVNAVCWPSDPADPGDRVHIGMIRVQAHDEWTRHEATFTIPSGELPLRNMRAAAGAAPWRIAWRVPGPRGEDDGYRFAAHAPGDARATVLLGDGWGQRDHRNTDRGATLPYIVRQREGTDYDAFVTVFEGAREGEALVRGVRILPLPEGAPPDAVAVEVTTRHGADVIVSMTAPADLTVGSSLGEVHTDARLAVVGGRAGVVDHASLVGGAELRAGGVEVACEAGAYGGEVAGTGSARGASWYALEGDLPGVETLAGLTLFVQDGAIRRAYPIRAAAMREGELRVYTKHDGVGFEAHEGAAWEVLPVAAVERR